MTRALRQPTSLSCCPCPRRPPRKPRAVMDAVGRADAQLHVPSTGLANSWPASGPKRLWTRPLGEGHSAILVESGRLYTHVPPARWRRPAQPGRIVAALDAATGKTIWEYSTPRRPPGIDFQRGRRAACHAAHRRQPALRRRHRAASSSRSTRTTGKVLWSHDLIKEYRRARRRSRHGVQPAALQRHHHRADRRARPGARRPSIRTPARWCGRPATSSTRRRRRS